MVLCTDHLYPFWDNGQVQMSLVWDGGIRYKKMRSWDRDGKRLRGSGDEQMQQIRELDSVLNSQFETLELDKNYFLIQLPSKGTPI